MRSGDDSPPGPLSDGTGYPDGLAGAKIPLGSRIIAVCDAFHAMTTNRPYRGAIDVHAAIAELPRCAGRQFDQAVVEGLCGVVQPSSGERLDGLDLPDRDRRLLV